MGKKTGSLRFSNTVVRDDNHVEFIVVTFIYSKHSTETHPSVLDQKIREVSSLAPPGLGWPISAKARRIHI